MTPSSRAAPLRSTALATSLALAVGLSVLAVDAWATPTVPLPKPRPTARNIVPDASIKNTAPATNTAAKNGAPVATPAPAPAPVANAAAKNVAPAATPAPALAPATRQHAALPPAPARKPPPPAAVATTSSTSQADADALENVIELVRKHKPADATQTAAAISDPVARKLAEWIILRSDDKVASIER